MNDLYDALNVHYAAQMATSRGGEMVITGLEPGKTYRVSVWVDGEIS